MLNADVGSSFSKEATEDRGDLRAHRGGTAPVLPCSLFLSVSAEALGASVWFGVHLPAGVVSPGRTRVWSSSAVAVGGMWQPGREEVGRCSGSPPGLAAQREPP